MKISDNGRPDATIEVSFVGDEPAYLYVTGTQPFLLTRASARNFANSLLDWACWHESKGKTAPPAPAPPRDDLRDRLARLEGDVAALTSIAQGKALLSEQIALEERMDGLQASGNAMDERVNLIEHGMDANQRRLGVLEDRLRLYDKADELVPNAAAPTAMVDTLGARSREILRLVDDYVTTYDTQEGDATAELVCLRMATRAAKKAGQSPAPAGAPSDAEIGAALLDWWKSPGDVDGDQWRQLCRLRNARMDAKKGAGRA